MSGALRIVAVMCLCIEPNTGLATRLWVAIEAMSMALRTWYSVEDAARDVAVSAMSRRRGQSLESVKSDYPASMNLIEPFFATISSGHGALHDSSG